MNLTPSTLGQTVVQAARRVGAFLKDGAWDILSEAIVSFFW